MKENYSYKKFVLLITGVGVISFIIFVVVRNFIEAGIQLGDVGLGLLINLVNVIIGTKIILSSLYKSNKQFLLISFGSMMVRLMVLMSIVLVVVLGFHNAKVEFIFSLLGFHFLFMIFEIGFFVKYQKTSTV
ncbi:MAG: hypothetical protein ACP5P3_04030 [Ignavibacteria bacterium]